MHVKSVMAALAVFMLVVALAHPAEAKRYHHRNATSVRVACEPDNNGRSSCGRVSKQQVRTANSRVEHHSVDGGLGIIRSAKTGATARVASRYSAKFQAYLNDVEAAGGRITFMGGIRPGPCAIPRSKHPCGMALDLCQFGRGVVDRKCELPRESTLAEIAERHGLVEGGVWCHGDRGHAEIRTDRQAEGCGRNLYSAVAKFRKQTSLE